MPPGRSACKNDFIVAETLALRIKRPYASVAEYLEAEYWTMDTKTMVLVGQEELPKDTTVRFEIVLESGDKPIRAEATVQKLVAARGSRPAGLKVRLRRIGAATKAIIDQALAIKTEKRSLPPPPPSQRKKTPPPAPSQRKKSAAPPPAEEPLPPPASERSGVRHRKVVQPPADRDELLARLRARTLVKTAAVPADDDTGS